MFRLIIEDKHIDYKLHSAAEVANAVFENTGDWMLASHAREVCVNSSAGCRFEYFEDGVVIECM